jgi:hypothetical protein
MDPNKLNTLDTLDTQDLAWPRSLMERFGCLMLGLFFLWLGLAGIWKTAELILSAVP